MNGATVSGPRHQLFALREDVRIEESPEGDLALLNRWGDLVLRRPDETVRDVVHRMCLGPIQLANAVRDQRAEAVVARLLERIEYLVVRSLGDARGELLLSVEPIAPAARFVPAQVSMREPLRLSRYAMMRTDGDSYRLESPLSLHRVVLHRPAAVALIGELGQAATPAVTDPLLADALAFLMAAGMVVQAEETGFAEDLDPALRTWAPIDLMFHTRSTLGRHDHDFGATYPLGRRRCPEPVVRPSAEDRSIPLYRPTWGRLAQADPTLSAALEARRSTRRYGPESLTTRELGELLYRTARVRSLVFPADGAEPISSSRPYPSGGSCHELEVYVTTPGGRDIPAGVYRYDPLGHRLEVVNTDRRLVAELLCGGRTAANASGAASVLLTITARFQRLSWKYTGLSYALVLKHVGVLTQNLYLVAAAMGLGGCALGCASLDTRAFGVDWLRESGLGAFLVGYPASPDHPSADHGRPVNDAEWSDRAKAELHQTRGQ